MKNDMKLKTGSDGVSITSDRNRAAADNEKSSNLLLTSLAMLNSLELMKDIIQNANFIALNAAIEAARTQSQTENFALVANQVRRQAERTDELARGLAEDIELLIDNSFRARAVNLTDIANDLIDKIDRNLFERNCDVQAWSGFAEIVNCAKIMRNIVKNDQTTKELQDKQKLACSEASEKLKVLTTIYPVYIDSWLVNSKGIIVASANTPEYINKVLNFPEVFTNISVSNNVYVSDVRYDPFLKRLVVNYCAGVKGEKDEIIGYVINHFNWNLISDIIEKMPVCAKTKLYVINKAGVVIASQKDRGILTDHMHWLDSGAMALDGMSGYSIECARNGRLSAWGVCHTFGYNAYLGKGWSAIVSVPVDSNYNRFICEEISREADLKKQASYMANENLKSCSARIQERVSSINTINNETNMLAVNAAIQAGVAGAEGEAFSVIASEIGQLARKSEDFVSTINSLTETLGGCVKNTIYARLGEAAFDCIDKIDRNLFERNCDIQAFASFSEIKNFLKIDVKKELMELLRKLYDIYEVYHDIILLDVEGNIVATAIHRELIGQNQADRNWFRDCITGHLVVTDLYFSNSINDHTVTFAAPVRNDEGVVIGALTTRFNCKFIYDIMQSTIVGKGAEVFLLNSKGLVIGSGTGDGILEKSMSHFKAFRAGQKEVYGHTIEEDTLGGGNFAIGFSKTQGYLNYAGKGWSVLIKAEAHGD